MARLCRFYISGAGNESARFNPLIIDLRDRLEWSPQNTIVWLRNGGGKTTLISLFYCIFVPKISDFLGMKNGKGAKLEDFVREGELAVIATEWQPTDAGAPRRTVGVLILKTPRELKRLFFSYNETSTTSFSFASLPARGLGDAAESFDLFREKLNEAMREFPSIELVLTEIQSVWIKHLDLIGLDTELFRTHLIMNCQEGGAADIFKIKNPEDFVRKFLELAYDEASTEEIEKNLQGFKEKRESAPHYLKSIEFGENLVRLLTPFSLDVAKRSLARTQQDELNKEASEARFSIQQRLATLDSEIADLETEIKNYADDIGAKTLDQRRLNTAAKGYRTLGKKYKAQETKLAFEVATTVEKEAELALAILKAAKEFALVRSLEKEHAALVREREKLHEDLRPQLQDLQLLGSRLKAAWAGRIADLEAGYELSKEQVDNGKSELINLTNEHSSLAAEIASATKDRDSAKGAIRIYEEAHRRLRESDAILAHEKANESLSRLKSETWTIGTLLEAAKSALVSLNSRHKASRTTLIDLNRSLADAQTIADKAQGRLTDEEEHRTQIERLAIVEEVVIGGDVQLRNSYLLSRLDEIAEEAQSKLIQIGVLDADDKRDDSSLDKFGLLAPTADVEALVSTLVANGIRTAMPAYHWLAEHCTTAKAAALCATNPAVWSGILIQDLKEFERARAEFKQAAIRAPITLFCTPPSEEAPLPSEVSVVGPEESGMYSKEAASLSQPAISGRRDERAAKQGDLEARRSSAHTAATRIRGHLRNYPAEVLTAWAEELAEAERQIVEFKREIETAQAEISGIEDEIAENNRQSTAHLERKAVVSRQESEVSTFIREHEQSIDANRSQFADCTTRVTNLTRDQENNKIRTSELRGSLDRLEETFREQDFKLREARQKLGALPSQYIGTSAAEPDANERPEDIDPEFNVAISNYLGLLTASDLDGRITGKFEELRKARESSTRATNAAKQAPEGKIEDASFAADIDTEIAEQDREYREAGQAKAVAKSNNDAAARECPADSDFKSGSLIDQTRETQPTTSEKCQEVAEEYEIAASELSAKIEDAKETKALADKAHSTKKTELLQYRGISNSLPSVPEAFVGHPQFTGIAEQDEFLIQALAGRISKNNGDLIRAEKSIDTRYDVHIHPHIQSPDFDPFRIEYRDRLKYLHKEDIASKAEALIEDISIAVAACRNDLEHEEQHRRIIIEQLDDIVQRATRLLSQASEVSKMPAESGAWAHQPFLRINVPKKSDKTERFHHLNVAMQGWYDTNSIPQGHALAFQCLIAVCGTKSINIKMLKPEYVATATPHDIIDLMKFSDGEKLTAAILLYCVLVRLRARQRAKQFHFGSNDSGLLLLDNPIGKATLNEFVELQVRVARLMGVQLVYATGIGAESALKHFPHIVRLKNSVRSRANNDHYVTLDENDHVVDGITLGVGKNAPGKN